MADKVKKEVKKETKKEVENKPLGKVEFVEMIAKLNNITEDEAKNVVNYFCDGVRAALKDHGGVKIISFADFGIVEKKERVARNPRTGEILTIEARKRVNIKISSKLHEHIGN